MWRCYLAVMVFQVFVQNSIAIEDDREDEEGDYDKIYPMVCFSMGIASHGHILPYALGYVEELNYPKDKINLILRIAKGQEDFSDSQSKWWIRESKALYRSIRLVEAEDDWLEMALTDSRRSRCRYVFVITADTLLTDSSILLRLIRLNATVVSPLLRSPFTDGVYEGLAEVTKLNRIGTPLLVDLRSSDSSYLTFDGGNLVRYLPSADPWSVFAESASRVEVSLLLDARRSYGYRIHSPGFSLQAIRSQMRYFLADAIADDHPLLCSPHLQPPIPIARRFGFDQIYVINLKRRPRRLAKMRQILDLLGISFTWWEAIDGNQLEKTQLESFNFLPEYQDPFHKRPMKLGEVGCFLSHYGIWQDVVKNSYKKVLILEDDIRMKQNAVAILEEVLEDLTESELAWHLIYLGRKILDADETRSAIPGQRHLTDVGYSYWTLAYALSLDGARQLIEAEPLLRLVPVDEFLPIMFDAHPNEQWKSHFVNRDLIAFTIDPLIVFPQKYTYEKGYVSDTEDSMQLHPVPLSGRDEL